MEVIRAISLGWGVQSWTLCAMSALGELPLVDFAIHSDTTFEYSRTYEFARLWTLWLEGHGVHVVTVRNTLNTQELTEENQVVMIPAYTTDGKGSKGQLRRQCTDKWKIRPIRRFLRQVMRERGIKLRPGAVEVWLGITLDEWQRAKDSNVQYVKNCYPFLDMDMTRQDCLNWLAANGLPSPGKSSCTFCPYHTRQAWKDLQRLGGIDWELALQIDRVIRFKRPPHALYVHNARLPLEDAINGSPGTNEEPLEDAECDSGYCFM